ncbi:MAG: methyltransferase domain-containing protein [Blastocatellia bacterium]|nr:methyltransferase domain-containing protein [Blastocatellia bacterium]
MEPKRLNIGCGAAPTRGWVNYDNSISTRLAGFPFLTSLLDRMGLLSAQQKRFISIVNQHCIRYANGVKSIPEPDHSVAVLYTSHMLEHLDRREAALFLAEARRVLVRNGIIRVAVPDLRFHINNYLANRNGDMFMENLRIARPRPTSMFEKLQHILIGERHHLWMYDGESLCRLLAQVGFAAARVLNPGETMILDPGELDLAEHAPESVFVEAVNPE